MKDPTGVMTLFVEHREQDVLLVTDIARDKISRDLPGHLMLEKVDELPGLYLLSATGDAPIQRIKAHLAERIGWDDESGAFPKTGLGRGAIFLSTEDYPFRQKYNWINKLWTEYALECSTMDKTKAYVFTVDSRPDRDSINDVEGGKSYVLPDAYVCELDDLQPGEPVVQRILEKCRAGREYAASLERTWEWGEYVLKEGEWYEVFWWRGELAMAPVDMMSNRIVLRLRRVLSYCDLMQEKGFLKVRRKGDYEHVKS